MNYIYENRRHKLLSRNEGKIKSYKSCADIRAWSHDQSVRGSYLREWMKSDMPICILPISTLISALENMTYRVRGKTAPRCRPGCKSKIVLDSVCASCQAIRECLKNDDKFEKYLVEEELETSHWPCERCLDALKNIKLFWKIIIDKIFKLQFINNEQNDIENNARMESVRSIAHIWRNDILQQALYVTNVNSGATFCDKKIEISSIRTSRTRLSESDEVVNHLRSDSGDICRSSYSVDKQTQHSYTSSKVKRKCNRRVLVKVSTQDASCDNMKIDNEDITAYKKNVQNLQKRCNLQSEEIVYLKRENESLKAELNNIKTKNVLATPFFNRPKSPSIPKPFDSSTAETTKNNSATDIDSEMIITVKKCENENFKHISLLQVLHKTNTLPKDTLEINEPSDNQEDPVELLKKVRNNFSAMVKREESIAHERKKLRRNKDSDIEATFHRVSSSTSDPLCSASSSISRIPK